MTDDCHLAMTILQETLSLAGRHALSGEFLAPEELHLDIPGQMGVIPSAFARIRHHSYVRLFALCHGVAD